MVYAPAGIIMAPPPPGACQRGLGAAPSRRLLLLLAAELTLATAAAQPAALHVAQPAAQPAADIHVCTHLHYRMQPSAAATGVPAVLRVATGVAAGARSHANMPSEFAANPHCFSNSSLVIELLAQGLEVDLGKNTFVFSMPPGMLLRDSVGVTLRVAGQISHDPTAAAQGVITSTYHHAKRGTYTTARINQSSSTTCFYATDGHLLVGRQTGKRQVYLELQVRDNATTCIREPKKVSGDGSPLKADDAVQLSLTHSLLKLRPGSPVPALAMTPLHLYAARNEYESFQVVLTAPAGATAAIVVTGLAVSPVVSPAIPIGAQVYRQHLINITEDHVTNCEGGAGRWPDALIPDTDVYTKEKRAAFPVTLQPGGEAVVFWVDLYVPATAAPGNVTLLVTAITEKFASTVTHLILEVAPFVLPSTASLATAFGQLKMAPEGHGMIGHDGGLIKPRFTSADATALQKKYIDAMLMHRVSGDFLQADELRLQMKFSGWAAVWGSFLSGRVKRPTNPSRHG